MRRAAVVLALVVAGLWIAAPAQAFAHNNVHNTYLHAVLDGLTAEDARQVYEAIRLAQPGGLGESPAMDVRGEPPNGKANWASGFLPAQHQAVMMSADHPIRNLSPPAEVSPSKRPTR